MAKLIEELKGVEQRSLNYVKEDILILGNNLNSIHNYLMHNINTDIKTINSILNEKDEHKKEFVTIVYGASLNANIYYYNKYFGINEIKGTAKTGESYNWIEKREYKFKTNEHGVIIFTYNVVELTEPKLNNKVNYNFVVDKSKNIIFINYPFFDLNKINNSLTI